VHRQANKTPLKKKRIKIKDSFGGKSKRADDTLGFAGLSSVHLTPLGDFCYSSETEAEAFLVLRAIMPSKKPIFYFWAIGNVK
jgi:hypothetical protein